MDDMFVTPTDIDTSSLKVALRFQRSDIPNLRRAADRAKIKDLNADVSTFELAADAAERNEPLIFECEDANQARLIAAGYVLHGCQLPTVDWLTRSTEWDDHSDR